MPFSPPLWRPMTPADLAEVERIAQAVHLNYPERPEVQAERLALFPAGNYVAQEEPGGAMVGYAQSHPGSLGKPPPLDSLLGRLPEAPDCLYLHDVALLPTGRGRGLGQSLMELLGATAHLHSLNTLALIAVGDSLAYWQKKGFMPFVGSSYPLLTTLATYGKGAIYLVKDLNPL